MAVLFRLSLVLMLVASGIALGAARGQLRVAGAVVLCTGSSTVQVQLIDAGGNPVSRTHICPDMALSLMAAVAQPVPDAGIRAGGVRGVAPVPVPVLSAGRHLSEARARGPPPAV